MIWEQQAYYNSWMHTTSEPQTNPDQPLNQVAYHEKHVSTNFLSSGNTNAVLDLSILSQFAPQTSLDTDATMLAVAEEGWHRAIVAPPSTNNQPENLSPSQFTAASDHDYKTEHDNEQVWDSRASVSSLPTLPAAVSNHSAILQECRPGKSKVSSRGAVVKKKHVSL